jgi:plastocyanin
MRRNVTQCLLGAVMVAAGCTAGGTPGWTAPPPPSVVAPSADQSEPPSPTPAVSEPSGSEGPDSGTVTVVARDLSFAPRDLSASEGDTLTVELQNAGRLTHNLTVDELGLKVVASPGKTKSLTIPRPAPGAYTFYCSVSGHRQAGMFGTLTVK